MSVRALVALLLGGSLFAQAPPPAPQRLDLDADGSRRITVHRDPQQYQGHPTTVLLGDGKTILCVHPEGHGKGAIVLQRSDDAGRSWSVPLPVPASFATSLETPTIHRLRDPATGRFRLVLFSGLHPVRSSHSEDDGATWTELQPIGSFGGIVAMASVVPLRDGSIAAWFHDDGRFYREGGKANGTFTVYQTVSRDGGLTWAEPSTIWAGRDLHLCEPGVVRSPDGKRLAMLLRENARLQPAQVMFSDDEAGTWSKPKPLAASLTGDRHAGGHAPDGRLVLAYRDMDPASPTRGDFVAWVGRFDDLEQGRPGQYHVRLLRNYRGTDCGYPGVELLADGTIVATTYGHWEPGQPPFVACVRFSLAELDALSKGPPPTFARVPGTLVPTDRPLAWWQKRVAEDLAAARSGGHRLLFVGDSITQGWNKNGKEPWDAKFAPLHALNLGISGDRTQNVLWRFDHGLLSALAAPNNDVRAVVMMLGTNNCNGDECSVEEVAQGIAAAVQRLRQGLPKAKVLLLAVFPRGETPGEVRSKCAAVSARAAALCAGDPMVVPMDIGAVFVGDGGAIQKDVMADFLHLTPEGYRRWAAAIEARVKEMVGG